MIFVDIYSQGTAKLQKGIRLGILGDMMHFKQSPASFRLMFLCAFNPISKESLRPFFGSLPTAHSHWPLKI